MLHPASINKEPSEMWPHFIRCTDYGAAGLERNAPAGHKLNEEQEDYLVVLSGFVERYEENTLPSRPSLSGIDTFKFIPAENSLTGNALPKIIGVDRSVAYRILKGERGLTADHIKVLCGRFGTSADVVIG